MGSGCHRIPKPEGEFREADKEVYMNDVLNKAL